MLDKFMAKLMESAATAYMPQIEQMTEKRRKELTEIKSKVRSDPSSVEEWFEQELGKLDKMDPADLASKLS